MWELLTHPWVIRGIVALLVLLIVPGICAYLIFLERKIAAWTQDRIGPNRVGPWGLLQSIADGLKFLLKEQIIPSYVNKVLYLLAPGIGVGCALLAIAVVPLFHIVAALVLMPALAGMLPGIELKPALALIPILNVSLVCKELLTGNFPALYLLMTFGSMSVFAGIALYAAMSQFQKEEVLFKT